MSVRTLYVARHGAADALGTLMEPGRDQCVRLAQRLSQLPLDAIWHSPLPRAADSAAIVSASFPGALVDEAVELVDQVPYVPPPELRRPSSAGFFDGYSDEEAALGQETAQGLIRRFCQPPRPGQRSTHELLITHAYPVAWLVREALGAPPQAWLSLVRIANTGLTILEFPDDGPPVVVCVNDQSHLASPSKSSAL